MHKKDGFLLAECMIVSALIALLASFSFSLMHVFEHIMVRAEVDLLTTIIEAQRAIALIDNVDSSVLFDVHKKTYVYNNVEHKMQGLVDFMFPAGSFGPPSNPTVPIERSISFAENRLVCFATGSMSSGVVYIGLREQQCFYALSS